MPDDTPPQLPLPLTVRRSRVATAYVPQPAPVAPDVTPWHVLAIMWQRRAFVLACIVLALAGGAVDLARSTPLFGSSSTLYVQYSAPKIVSDDLSSGSAAGVNLSTQCELITSTAILGQAAALPGMAAAQSLRGSENPVGFLKSVVRADANKEGELITVSATSPYPSDAAVIVNGVVQAYVEYQNRQHQSAAVQVAGILQREYDSHDAELKDEQARMLKLRLENPQLVSQFDRRDAGTRRAPDVGDELSQARVRADDLRAALRTATASQDQPARLRQLIQTYRLADLLPPSALPELSTDYRREVALLNHLQATHHGPSSDLVVEAQADLDRTRADLDQAGRQEAADCLETIRAAAAAAADKVQQLQGAFEAERQASLSLNAKAAEYDQLASAAERNARSLDALDGRLKDIRFTEDVGPMTISVLETAKGNYAPVSPIRTHVMGEALVAGLMAGLAVALLADRLDQRLRSVEEIPALIDASILGVVPRVLHRGAANEVGRETQLRPRSAVAEAFRSVRTAIYFGADERALRTILVTSPAPGDGKSTSVSNLAIAVAQAGRRVLLIDADCRRPVQHKIFNLREGLGLTTVLGGRCGLGQAVQRSEVVGLDVLPCGPVPHNPAEVLDSQAMVDLLAEASRLYDLVLVDSPPVNMVSDARVLAASCDAAFLVLRAERSTRRGATLAWGSLASVGAYRLGVVVNDVTRATDGYGYTYYGRYGYGPAKLKGEANGSNGDEAAAGGG